MTILDWIVTAVAMILSVASITLLLIIIFASISAAFAG